MVKQKDEKLQFWSYIDIDDDFSAWEVAIGRFQSLNLAHKYALSIRQINSLRNAVKYQEYDIWKMELELESFRRQYYPNKVSRLRGLFLFESEIEAKENSAYWGEHFSEEYLTDIGFLGSETIFSKYDSKWITHYKYGDVTLLHNYFSGQPYDNFPQWEIVAYGSGVIWNRELKQKAYDQIIKHEPYTKSILDSAVAIFHFGLDEVENLLKIATDEDRVLAYNVASTVPFATLNGDCLDIEFAMNMNAFEKFGIYQEDTSECRLPDSRHLKVSIDVSQLKGLNIELITSDSF